MVQKYIAVLCAVLLFGATTPAFAGDYVNHNLLAKVRLSNVAFPALASSNVLPSKATFGSMAGSLAIAMAPPQSGQGQAQQAKPRSGELTTKGKVLKWVGIGLIAEGAFDAAYGAAILKDPCSGYSSGRCTSNYSTVRGTWLGASAGVAVVGVILLVKGLHSKQ